MLLNILFFKGFASTTRVRQRDVYWTRCVHCVKARSWFLLLMWDGSSPFFVLQHFLLDAQLDVVGRSAWRSFCTFYFGSDYDWTRWTTWECSSTQRSVVHKKEGENKHHPKGGGWREPLHPERRRRKQHHPRKRNNIILHLDIWCVSDVFQGWSIILSMCSSIRVCLFTMKIIAIFIIVRFTLRTRKLWFVEVTIDRDARQTYLRFFAFYLFLLLFFFNYVSFNERFLLFFCCLRFFTFFFDQHKKTKNVK